MLGESDVSSGQGNHFSCLLTSDHLRRMAVRTATRNIFGREGESLTMNLCCLFFSGNILDHGTASRLRTLKIVLCFGEAANLPLFKHGLTEQLPNPVTQRRVPGGRTGRCPRPPTRGSPAPARWCPACPPGPMAPSGSGSGGLSLRGESK